MDGANIGHGVLHVAAHGGAGYHSHTSEREVKHALRRSCREALKTTSALSAVERAISVLEDEECLNAGYGSNLTIDGTVECDAAIMDGQTGDFGSIGAVSGVKNPVKLANAVLQASRRRDQLGRIPPLTLVSEGARLFAAKENLEIIPPESLVSAKAKKDWEKWKTRLDSEGDESAKEKFTSVALQDTVGAVAWDGEGNMAAGVSSGGILLKYSGRIGEAATFGSGCWAHQSEDGGMACSITGTGEYIVRTMLARSLGEALRKPADVDTHEVLQQVLVDQFWVPIHERGEPTPNAGVLLLTKEIDDGQAIPRLWCAFTTETMAIAYASSEPGDTSPKSSILRRPKNSHAGSVTNSPIYITALPIGK
ncbi:hypothetical protein SERLA73DRAFT_179800 [Serpula lacrymans var. lacrymans S7.3]|uniref:N-terminal nucleophile aminohydrolase n=2 Tax=Serpula lacrymans var. lacrymans TaxID=341189 RepID=F8PUE9_SERL3|nr:uncharacterized protein SERLADRAFT_465070 [Serpula lacrymans var. lacrymans S7.9]EGN99669.1 hypothetical protein SERLA73DRAFT_179800 [Serpula lacrymans var. lacrymans S7.3]EGO25231.1 hypothetical protein SERLADRAFT_465070 [Serpula lacrymans var. lacrymans S7.9]